ncbi:MAG: methyl-accepting chemotaxis protein, partial [Epulopiscium sp.]|nr:methyl-accepting chemotaxis protein [Candidatus Epulonipiscium sp.]
GEAGRGFAVVANEIKQLADQSTEFTGEINSIINELTQKTASAVETMKTGAEVIAQQSAHVTTTSNQFDGIAQAIDDMKEVIDFVNKSSDDMARQKEEIVNIMEQLSAISEQNAAGSQEASASVEEQTASTEEIANSSDDLAKLAEELNERVSIFKI